MVGNDGTEDRSRARTACPSRVSIIIPIYNRAAMLGQLLVSVGAQTYRDIEVIVIDDGSDDLDEARVAALADQAHVDHPVHYRRQENGGVASARNLGIRHSSGAFFYFLDSDDLIFPHAIEALVAALRTDEATAYAVARIVDIDISLRGRTFETHQDDPANILRSAEWCTHASLYRREPVLALGGFDETLRVGEDTIFQIRMRLEHGAGARCGALVGVRRRHRHGHLSLDHIPVAERSRFLIASAALIGGNPLFSRERFAVRLTSLAVFLTILARARRQRSDAADRAFRTIADTLLHDAAATRRLVTWLTVRDADWRLLAAVGVIGAARAGRSAVNGLRRRRARRPEQHQTMALIDRLRAAVAEAQAGR